MTTKLRKSQAIAPPASYPGLRYLTLDEFKLIVIGFALQNRVDNPDYEGLDIGDHLRWMLAYWRADHVDDNRFDKAELYMYGRVGYAEIESDEEILETLLCAVAPDMTASEVPHWDATDFIDWAFNTYVEWAPEPVKVYRDASAFRILIAQTSIMLAQFVDHFEQCEVEYLMMHLVTGYGRRSPVWDLFDHPDKNIEVEVNEQSDRILVLTTPGNGWLKIHWPNEGLLSVTWAEPKS
jgi:hypothetical protein